MAKPFKPSPVPQVDGAFDSPLRQGCDTATGGYDSRDMQGWERCLLDRVISLDSSTKKCTGQDDDCG